MTHFPIQTDRLQIRPFRPDDWTAVYSYTSNTTVMHYMPKGVMNGDEAQLWTQKQASDEAEAYAVTLLETGQLIGHADFHEWFAPRIYEIGWVFHPDHQGKGYATEAARAMLRYGFETLGVHRIIATCQPENIGSWRVMEKLGMVREGHLRQCIERPNGVWWDEYFYAILKTDWEAQNWKKGG